ncbi:hypothetical protein EVAR_18891_1 [Eumeta japonica]|uniref:Uncharacterized protein n=1 Tax=Eumeta variegata TaxID=151549 RepID=A0A4C1V2J8_EUMVA|nr:hypothetical protein EVAR_18891_1 [Eumeta japonica]
MLRRRDAVIVFSDDARVATSAWAHVKCLMLKLRKLKPKDYGTFSSRPRSADKRSNAHPRDLQARVLKFIARRIESPAALKTLISCVRDLWAPRGRKLITIRQFK